MAYKVTNLLKWETLELQVRKYKSQCYKNHHGYCFFFSDFDSFAISMVTVGKLCSLTSIGPTPDPARRCVVDEFPINLDLVESYRI